MLNPRRFSLLVVVLACLLPLVAKAEAGKYSVVVLAVPRSDYVVDVEIATDLPDGALLRVDLRANGKAPASLEPLIFRETSRRWLMEEGETGGPWEPAEWTERFGPYETCAPCRGDPEDIRLFYFPQIDMTLAVDAADDTIAAFRDGRPDGE